jgi:hypothetical protein
MRDAINNNPIAQLAVVAVLLLITGFLLMSGPLKKEESQPTPPAGTADPGAAVPGAAPVPATGAVSSAAPVVLGPPLPPEVTAAEKAGKVLALLVVRAGGPDDRLLRSAVAKLRNLPGLAVFATRASGIARYARITQGVDVDRVPALIVVRPSPTPSGVASAEVRYGFRDDESVVQAVRDVLYRGPAVGYSPD